jgi:hypothetical protein
LAHVLLCVAVVFEEAVAGGTRDRMYVA